MSEVGRRFSEYRDRYLEAVLESVDRAVVRGGLEDTSLEEMLRYHLRTGGKRLRALLPTMVADALECDPGRVVGFGAACELIHNATLVHDDLQDGDRVRRGQPAVWAKYGQAEAINLGDALLYLAPLCLEEVDASADVLWAVSSDIFTQVLRVIDGQQREFELRFGEARWPTYERMVEGKTSGLFALPMVGAARLCGAEQAVRQALEEAAGHLGVLFQMQDDVLDLYGEKGREQRGGDLREGKISALVVAFCERGTKEEIQRLQAVIEAPREATNDRDVQWAIEAFRQRGALGAVLEVIDERRRRALEVQGLAQHPTLRQLVDDLAALFVEPIKGVK